MVVGSSTCHAEFAVKLGCPVLMHLDLGFSTDVTYEPSDTVFTDINSVVPPYNTPSSIKGDYQLGAGPLSDRLQDVALSVKVWSDGR